MDRELFDVGAQAERTALSWQRTGIGVIVIGALVLRWCVTVNYPLWPGIALAAAGSVISLFLVRHRYRRVLHTVTAGQSPTSRYLIPGVALFMVLVVVALTIAIILTPGMAHADNSRLNNSVVAAVDTIRNHAGCTADVKMDPQLTLAAQWHTVDVLNNHNLDEGIGSDGSTPQSRSAAAGFNGTVAETVAINPALAINSLEVLNQWYYEPAEFAIMSDCANTAIGVWSENSLDRSVVVAVYGKSA